MKRLFRPDPEAMRMKGDYNGLIKLAKSRKERPLRVEALLALGNLKTSKSVPVSIELFSDPDPVIRDAASQSLAMVGSYAVDDLIALYATDTEIIAEMSHQTLVRMGEIAVVKLILSLSALPISGKERAVFTLVEIGEPAIPSLMHALGDKDETIRDLAEVALDKIGKPAIPYLIQGLQNADTEIQARSATILILKEQDVVSYLIAAMPDDTEENRSLTFFILQQIGDTVFEPLLEAIISHNPVTRSMGIDAFIGYGPAVIPSLLHELVHGTSDSRHAAGTVLIRFGSDAVNPLAEEIISSDTESRTIIATIMEDIGDASVPVLIRLIHHPDKAVVKTASEALARIGSPSVERLLLDGMGKDASYTEPIKNVIQKIGEDAVPILQEVIKQDDADSAVFALGMIQNIAPLIREDILVQALHSSSYDVRDEAARSLFSMGSSVISRLVSLLSDPSDDVVMRVQSLLIKMGRPAVPYLLQEISGPIKPGSPDIEWIIKQIGDDAVPDLIASIRKDSPEAETAMNILAESGISAIPPLLPLITDQDSIVRNHATTLIKTLFKNFPDDTIREIAHHASPSAAENILNILSEDTTDLTSILLRSLQSEDELVVKLSTSLLVASGEKVVLPLIESMHSCEESYGLVCTSILVQIGTPSIAPLIHAIVDTDIRIYAIAALGTIGEPAVEPLLSLLSDPDESVAAIAGLALGKIGEPALSSLLPLFFSNNTLTKVIGEVLREIGAPAIPPLLFRMREEQDTSTRQYAILIATIISIGLSERQSLFELFAIPDKKTAYILGNAMSLHGTDIINPLLNAVAAHGKDLPFIVAAAISKIGQPAIPLIQIKMEEYSLSDDQVIPFIRLLSVIGDPKVVPLLKKWFKSPNADIRAVIISSLKPFGSEGTDLFIMAMKDEPVVKLAGVTAMGSIGLPVLDHLLLAMKDSDNEIRSAAVAAIAKIGLPAQYMLIQMLIDANRQVRYDAFTLLQDMGWVPKYTTDRLAYLYASEDWNGLIAIGAPAIDILEQGTYDTDPEITRKAQMSLQSIQKNASLQR